ncbi:MAG: flippase [Solirubrobacterales bacterium]|nr:flippase [Solirubrobacterales bacterium]
MTTKDVTRAHATRDVLVQLGGRAANLALGVVATVLIVRTLGVEGNGQWATLLAVTAIFSTIGELGLEPTAVRRAAAAPGEEAGWLGALLGLRLLTAVPAAVLAGVVCVLLTDTREVHVAGALMAGTIVAAAPQSLRAAFQLRVRNDRSIAVITVGSLLWTAGVIVVASRDGSIAAFAAVLLAATALTTLVQAALVRRSTPVALAGLRRHGSALLRAGLPLGIASGLALAYGRIDQLLVLHYDGARGAGLYGSAYLLLERLQVLPAAVMTTALPLLAAAWPADLARTRRLVTQALEVMALIALPIVAFAAVAARPAVVALFGEDFAPAAGVLPVLMLAFACVCVGHVLGYLSIVVERQRAFVWIALGALALNVGANAVLLPRYGYRAAAWTTLATELLVIVWAGRVTLTGLGGPVRPARLARVVTAAALMAAVVLALRGAGLGAVGLAAAAGVTYPLALLACGALRAEDRARLLRLRPGGA